MEEEEEEAVGDLSLRKVLEGRVEVEVEAEAEGEERTWWQTMIWEWMNVLALMGRLLGCRWPGIRCAVRGEGARTFE